MEKLFLQKIATLLLACFAWSVVSVKAQNTFELKKRIVSSTDDAEEHQTGGTMDITSSDVELVYDGSTAGNQTVGLRFTNIDIPKDATIVSAYIQFTVDETAHTGATSVNIYGEATDNSSAFASTAFNITNRTKTSNSVAWNNLALWTTVNQAGADQRTPDLKSLVIDITQRSGWKQGNALTFLINGSGRRNAHAFDGTATGAPELIITYILKSPPIVNFPIAANGVWSYNDSGLNLGTNWRTASYVDTTWPFYVGKFGYGDGNEKTPIQYGSDPSNKYITTYFRKKFNVVDSSAIDSLLFKILVDDGAVVYLNGVEVFRRNMPTGTIGYKSTAITSIYGSDENAYFEHRVGAVLRNGINILAVEVHQSDPESIDMGFDLQMFSKKPPMAVVNFPIPRNSEWYYNDKGLNLYGTNWTEENYAPETLWDYGKGALGYGDPMGTTISFGGNSANKHVAYYFRKKINIVDTALINSDFIDFNIRRDDAAVVFVNGVEVLRQNIDTGKLTNRSISQTIVDGGNETTYYTTSVSKKYFKNGINQIAVAVHQRDSISSDLGFDMEITPKLKPNPAAMGCTEDENHIACFTSITPSAPVNRLVIPTATHAFQQIAKQGTPYSLISGNLPGGHDFTAYVGRNNSSTDGVVAINHENSPGAVSLVYVRYIDSTQLWVVDSSKRVDFYNNDLVSTVRNCSGGITPWGTVITSEESVSSADANADGYFDIGWNVEFNPWTGKVMEYGNGKQEKLWALGRMSHENVVVSKDSVTVYQGEDGGTNLVYKFVADKKMDLSKGKLYVLVLDQPLLNNDPTGTTGKWVLVPNTTQADRNNCNSLAAALGGTRFSGVEDVEINPVNGKIYFTAKGLNRVYSFKDADTTLSEFITFVGGKNYIINNGTNSISEPWASGNDNLTFDDKGNLWVLQDGSRNYMWLVRPDHTQAEPKVELFLSPSLSAEPTGMTFTPDFKFMFLSIQHPSSSNVAQLDATGNSIDFKQAATVIISRKEYLGLSIPTVDFISDTTRIRAGASINFEDISYPKISSRKWIFEGAVNTTSTSVTPTVQYNTPGVYKVKLIATNRIGTDSLERVAYIEVLAGMPTANFTANKTTVYEGDSVKFSDISTGLVQYRKWNFNGAHIANSMDSTVVVQFAKMGTYSVSISVGNYGDTVSTTKTNYITVLRRAPIANFTANKTTVSINEALQLTDLSQNLIENRKWTVNGATLVGNSTDSILTVSFSKRGKYTVKLFVSNAGGADSLSKALYIHVKPLQPIANFTANKTNVLRNDTVTLTDLSTNSVDSRKWTVTGATVIGSLTDSIVKVKYPVKGSYTVKLWIMNETGKDSLVKVNHIQVGPLKPVVNFSANKTDIMRNNSVVFTDNSTEDISSRVWTFTGGTPSTGTDAIEVVTYAVTGNFDVQLQVTNASGSTTQLKSAYIKVSPATSIESVKDIANLTLYPNPIKDFFKVGLELFETTTVSIEITDLTGKVIGVLYSGDLNSGKQELEFNVESLNLNTGTYLLNIKIGERVITKKIVKS